MSFKTEIYPYRNNRMEFTSRLLKKVDTEFKKIEPVDIIHGSRNPGHHYTASEKNVPGVGSVLFKYPNKRCQFRKTDLWEGKKWECNFNVTLVDKSTIKALLKAWARMIDDRYLDRDRIEQLRKRKFSSQKEAFDMIRQNAPLGAVMFLRNELEAWDDPPLFGAKLNLDYNYNDYYSQLLKFDIERCGGLVIELARLNEQVSLGTGSDSYVIDAAMYWINYNQNHGGVYFEWRL